MANDGDKRSKIRKESGRKALRESYSEESRKQPKRPRPKDDTSQPENQARPKK
jgi:hypothetical protein